MHDFYGETQRALQDRFDTRRLADRLDMAIIHDTVEPDEKAFIESRDLFFLSTVGADGQPTVSYKGGPVGFVRVVDDRTLAFPNYDGNGMYLSMGNAAATAKVGLLFIDFERPHRLRAHGVATVSADDPLLGSFPGADLVVRVALTSIHVNCPRYIHPHVRKETSRYVPQAGCEQPVPGWKRIDLLQDALPGRDADAAAKGGGVITKDEYVALMVEGKI
ncbi:pyridoxamine 5'-phosphate oxidase family protein [Prosthecomicrobium sp. N25]|uniref:pyridoxamine 5'-phosphate oxidase family protein n=1 Tax=Prosthecomicrobium sp. N25 TaxID=3129254 RepID=UPI003077F2BB